MVMQQFLRKPRGLFSKQQVTPVRILDIGMFMRGFGGKKVKIPLVLGEKLL